MASVIDVTGQVFGRLIVIDRDGVDAQGRAMWSCYCECGATKRILGKHLRSGAIRSCGCLNQEMRIERAKKGVRRGVFTEHVTYRGAHIRVRIVRGRASEYRCQCGAQSEEWAYDHADPNALLEKVTMPRGNVREAPYSLDPNHYIPMCKSCHSRFDATKK